MPDPQQPDAPDQQPPAETPEAPYDLRNLFDPNDPLNQPDLARPEDKMPAPVLSSPQLSAITPDRDSIIPNGPPPLNPATSPHLTSLDPDRAARVFSHALDINLAARADRVLDALRMQTPHDEVERWIAYVPEDPSWINAISAPGVVGLEIANPTKHEYPHPTKVPSNAIWGRKYKDETNEEALARLKRVAEAKRRLILGSLFVKAASTYGSVGLLDNTQTFQELYHKAAQVDPNLEKSLVGFERELPLVGKLSPFDIASLTGFFAPIPGNTSSFVFGRLSKEFQRAAIPGARSAIRAFEARYGSKVVRKMDWRLIRDLERHVEEAGGIFKNGYIHLPTYVDPDLRKAISFEAKRAASTARELTGINKPFKVISTAVDPTTFGARLSGNVGTLNAITLANQAVAAATHPDQAKEILKQTPNQVLGATVVGAGVFFPAGEALGLFDRGRLPMGHIPVPKWEKPRRMLGTPIGSDGRYVTAHGQIVDRYGKFVSNDLQEFAHTLEPAKEKFNRILEPPQGTPEISELLRGFDQSSVDPIRDLNAPNLARRTYTRAQYEQGSGEVSVGSLIAHNHNGLTHNDVTEVPVIQRNGRLYGLKDVDGKLQAIDITDSLAPLELPAEGDYRLESDPTSPIEYTFEGGPEGSEHLTADPLGTAAREPQRQMQLLGQNPNVEVDTDPMTLFNTITLYPPTNEARRGAFRKQAAKLEAQLNEDIGRSREMAEQIVGPDAEEWQIEQAQARLLAKGQADYLMLRQIRQQLGEPATATAPAASAAVSNEPPAYPGEIPPGAYSRLWLAINDFEGRYPKGVKAASLLNQLRKTPKGLSKDELKRTGFDEWLKTLPPDQKVTAEDLRQRVAKFPLEVKQTDLKGDNVPYGNFFSVWTPESSAPSATKRVLLFHVPDVNVQGRALGDMSESIPPDQVRSVRNIAKYRKALTAGKADEVTNDIVWKIAHTPNPFPESQVSNESWADFTRNVLANDADGITTQYALRSGIRYLMGRYQGEEGAIYTGWAPIRLTEKPGTSNQFDLDINLAVAYEPAADKITLVQIPGDFPEKRSFQEYSVLNALLEVGTPFQMAPTQANGYLRRTVRTSGHFDEGGDNLLGDIMGADTTDTEGRAGFSIIELQSDWENMVRRGQTREPTPPAPLPPPLTQEDFQTYRKRLQDIETKREELINQKRALVHNAKVDLRAELMRKFPGVAERDPERFDREVTAALTAVRYLEEDGPILPTAMNKYAVEFLQKRDFGKKYEDLRDQIDDLLDRSIAIEDRVEKEFLPPDRWWSRSADAEGEPSTIPPPPIPNAIPFMVRRAVDTTIREGKDYVSWAPGIETRTKYKRGVAESLGAGHGVVIRGTRPNGEVWYEIQKLLDPPETAPTTYAEWKKAASTESKWQTVTGNSEEGFRTTVGETYFKQWKEALDKAPDLPDGSRAILLNKTNLGFGAEWTVKLYGDTAADIKAQWPNKPELLKYAYDRPDGKPSEATLPGIMRKLAKRVGARIDFLDLPAEDGTTVKRPAIIFDAVSKSKLMAEGTALAAVGNMPTIEGADGLVMGMSSGEGVLKDEVELPRGPKTVRETVRQMPLTAEEAGVGGAGPEPLPTLQAVDRLFRDIPDDLLKGLGITLVDAIPRDLVNVETEGPIVGLHRAKADNTALILLRAQVLRDARNQGDVALGTTTRVLTHELMHQVTAKAPLHLRAALLDEFMEQKRAALDRGEDPDQLYRFATWKEYAAETAAIETAERFNDAIERIKGPRLRRYIIALRDLVRRYIAKLQDLGDRLGVYKPSAKKPASQVLVDFGTGKISENQAGRLGRSLLDQAESQASAAAAEAGPESQLALRHLQEFPPPWGQRMSDLHDAMQPLSSRMMELMLEAEDLPANDPRRAEIKTELKAIEEQARKLTTEMFEVEKKGIAAREALKRQAPTDSAAIGDSNEPQGRRRRRKAPPTREEAVSRIGGKITKEHADLLTPAERIRHYHLRLANLLDSAVLTPGPDGQPKFGGLLKHLKNLRIQRGPDGVITKPSYFAGWKPTEAEFAEMTRAHKARQAQLNHVIKGLKRAQKLAEGNTAPSRNKAGAPQHLSAAPPLGKVPNTPVTPLTTEELVNVANTVLTNPTLREAMTPEQLATVMYEVTPRRAAERLAKSVAEASKLPLPQPDREAVMDFWDLIQDHQATWLAEGRDIAVQLDQAFRQHGMKGIISRPWRWAADHSMAVLHWLADSRLRLSRPDEVLGPRGELANADMAINYQRQGGQEKSVWGLLYGDENSGAQGIKQFLARTSDSFAPIFALERADPKFAAQLLKAVTQAWPDDLPEMQKTYQLNATLARTLGLPVKSATFKLADAARVYRQFFDQTMTHVADSRKMRATYTATRLHTVAQNVRARLTESILGDGQISPASLPAGFTTSNEGQFIDWLSNEKNWKSLTQLVDSDAGKKRLRNQLRGLRHNYDLYRQQNTEYDLWDTAQKVLAGEVDWDTALRRHPDLPIRRDYAPVLNMANLIRDDLKLELEDPYSVYQYLDDKVYNSFLKARKADELPDLYLFEMMGLYVPSMAKSIYLEPALIKAMPKVLELPARHQLYAKRWIDALKGKVDPYQGALHLGLADVLARGEKPQGGKAQRAGTPPARIKARRQDAYDRFVRPLATLSFMGTVRPSSLGVVNVLEQLWVPGMLMAHGDGGLFRGLPSQAKRAAAGVGRWALGTAYQGPRDLAKEGSIVARRALANKLGNVPPEHSPEYYAGAFRALSDQGQYEFYNMFRSALGTAPDPNKIPRAMWHAQFHFQTGVDMWERMSAWNTFYNDAMHYATKSLEVRKDSMGRHYLYDTYTNKAEPQRFPSLAVAERAKQAKAVKESRWYAKYMVDTIYSDYSIIGQSPFTRGGLLPWVMQLKRFGLNKLDLMLGSLSRASQARENGIRTAEFGWMPSRMRDMTKAAMRAASPSTLPPEEPGALLRQDVGKATGEPASRVSIPREPPRDFTPAEQEAYTQLMSGVQYFQGARASNQAINAARRQLFGFGVTGYSTLKLAPMLGINSLYSLPWFQAATPVLSLMGDLWDMVPATAMQAAGGDLDQYQRRNLERIQAQLTTALMPGGAFVRDWQREQVAKLMALNLPPAVLQKKIREIMPAPWEDPMFTLGGGLYQALDLNKILYGDVRPTLKRLYTVPSRRPEPPKTMKQLLQERSGR